MKKLLTLLVTAAAITAAPAPRAQGAGEVIGAAVVDVPSDLFGCGAGSAACNLQCRVYNLMDPGDFSGSANPTDGFPRFRRNGRYEADPQITGNYPSAFGQIGLSWYSTWDGVVTPETFLHAGYYGAQSQIINQGELGNPLTANCLPVTGQVACFPALTRGVGNDLSGFGPAGSVPRAGGLSPMPRPVVYRVDATQVELQWEEAAAISIEDNAPNPIIGYKVYLLRRPLDDRVGPSQFELQDAELLGDLIDLSPGTVLPRTTTSLTVNAADSLLADFDPATESLVAVSRLIFAMNIPSTHFSAHSFPFTFSEPAERVEEFQARLADRRVVLTWRVDGLAGIRGFSILAAGRSDGPYHPVDLRDVEVNGAQGTFILEDRLDGRFTRNSRTTRFYRLEVAELDGTRVQHDQVLEVNIRPALRGNGSR